MLTQGNLDSFRKACSSGETLLPADFAEAANIPHGFEGFMIHSQKRSGDEMRHNFSFGCPASLTMPKADECRKILAAEDIAWDSFAVYSIRPDEQLLRFSVACGSVK